MSRVRPAATEDAGAIAAVGVRSWREGFRDHVSDGIEPEEAWNEESVRNRLDTAAADRPAVLVAERDAEIVGFVTIGPARDDDASDSTGEIWALFVDPSAWRSGVGRRLVAAALAELNRRGFAAATVWTFAESERNIAFYEALGFSPDGATQSREPLGHAPEARLRVQLPRG